MKSTKYKTNANRKEKKNELNPPNQKEKAGRKKEKLRIFLIVWLIGILLLSFASNFFGKEIEKVEYVDFLEQVEKGEIEEITVNSSKGDIKYKIDKNSYYTNYPYTDTFIENMLLQGVDVKYSKPINMNIIVTVGSTILMVAVMFFIIRKVTKAPGTEKNFYSDVRIANSEKVGVTTFDDIAGMDEIKDDLRSLAEIVKNKEYKQKGVVVPKGVLLDGPPGNGKTLLARAFAGECGLNFIALNAADFGSPFVGVTGQKINQAFKDAKTMAPCVIFIDEIDAIGSKRTTARTGAEKEFNSSLTSLLGNMDGFTPSDDILVIAATNRAEDLDAALVRQGRFDRKFTIGVPDKKTRLELFKLYTKDAKLADDVSLENLANQTYGRSSAAIKGIVNEALISSIKNKRDAISDADFSNAIIRTTINGVEKKTDRWEGKTKNTVAYHEAGHAVLGHLLGRSVTTISIIPTTASAGGYTLLNEDEDDGLKSLSDYRNTIMVLYGGRAAEAVLEKDVRNISIGASQDIKQATHIASSVVNFADGVDYSAFGERGIEIVAKKAKDELEILWKRAYEMIQENWSMVEKVAEELKVKEKISSEEFLKIVNSHEVA